MPRLASGTEPWGNNMVRVGLYVGLETKPGRAQAPAAFLAQRLARENHGGLHAYLVRSPSQPSSFAILDVFTTDADRDQSVGGPNAATREGKSYESPVNTPMIEPRDVLARQLRRIANINEQGVGHDQGN